MSDPTQAAPDEQKSDAETDAAEPSTEDLQEPSTEKDPGEEPKAPAKSEPEADHEAVGIGILGRPQTDDGAAD